jgi:hypothetical protein
VTESSAGEEPGQWLGQTEAAARLGWHLERVRAAARRGRLQRRKGNAGQWLIFVPDRLTAGADRGNGQGGDPADDSGDALGAGGLAVDLRDELADLHGAVAEAIERAIRAEGRAARAEGELAVKDTLVAELREMAATERARADRLEAALAEARKPALVRLLEAIRRR